MHAAKKKAGSSRTVEGALVFAVATAYEEGAMGKYRCEAAQVPRRESTEARSMCDDGEGAASHAIAAARAVGGTPSAPGPCLCLWAPGPGHEKDSPRKRQSKQRLVRPGARSSCAPQAEVSMHVAGRQSIKSRLALDGAPSFGARDGSWSPFVPAAMAGTVAPADGDDDCDGGHDRAGRRTQDARTHAHGAR
ncbi:hypothetical protein BDY21DRAFT_344024 [Lineolata rhizophorae]|uniref:Uncharacterized protein n=1 Tax=Lineolata rhizophorae TaxID=578093 RepID=A0A6A6P117_9PEZI|nr:hypothetical protein BDY21DRAFT_344024 [Lineolata rhizophorae]